MTTLNNILYNTAPLPSNYLVYDRVFFTYDASKSSQTINLGSEPKQLVLSYVDGSRGFIIYCYSSTSQVYIAYDSLLGLSESGNTFSVEYTNSGIVFTPNFRGALGDTFNGKTVRISIFK